MTASRVKELRRASRRPALAPAPAGAVSLAMGEPDFPTPPSVTEAAVAALRAGHSHYADQRGLRELRSALASRLPAHPGRNWTADDVVVTHGATAALAAVVFATIGPGDRVVVPEPAYSLYADLVVLAGGIVDFVPLAPDLHWDLDALAEALPGAAMMIFSNPCNPTGIVHSKQELETLGKLLDGSDVLVVSDEAYHRLVYPGHELTSALEIESLRDRTVYVQTFSKTYAMTGWRVGYLTGPREVVDAAAQVHRTHNGSLNTAVQHAALAALELPDATVDAMVDTYRQRRELVVAHLSGVPGLHLIPPEGAFYGFLRYDTGLSSEAVVRELAEREVMVRAGAEYGPSGEGHVRISFAASEDDLWIGLERIVRYFGGMRS
ncbi:aminotransferase class I/II-fold pyridoxal phosphate-dependent enzyme [Streptomyces sp. ME02-6987-2C]|uniref:pyridoxal phosphate-dependent aminotransferase n=1 Tax=unclassified Streptomyces TaxID=2593676 RepID=UPI0029A2440B|nr:MULTISPECIES: aminotransferase class I/II-fold pyridoxal phosphate-dependent enzyme [unclassified Streptomyces]MDX3367852.1 aminotransferase class I/II-fold pyridoxal phosphate-dependent enzyme [Streptomyces sp. ME02-6987-2C]MDX3426905.1 aminotransferase class I/II-fold pyridoxal phosphate-dependent enzyme [Streptomyces sp. ME02-6985-2c]